MAAMSFLFSFLCGLIESAARIPGIESGEITVGIIISESPDIFSERKLSA